MKVSIHLLCDPAALFLGIYMKKRKLMSHKVLYASFIVAVFM